MMRISLFVFLALACWPAIPANAQPDEFAVLHEPIAPSLIYSYRHMRDDGMVLDTLGWVPIWGGPPHQASIAPDNREVRALVPYGFVLDLGARGRTTYVATGPQMSFAGAFAPQPDGDMLIANGRGSFVEILSWSNGQFGLLTTLATKIPTGRGIDPLNGEVVFRATPYDAPLINRYYFVNPRTGASRSRLVPRFQGGNWIHYDVETDTFTELFAEQNSGNLRFNRIDRNGQIVLTKVYPPAPYWTLAADMVAASRRGQPVEYWALVRLDIAGYVLLGLRGDGSIARSAPVSSRRVRPHFVRLRSESLVVALNNAPNDRTLRLSFPLDAGKQYVAALSLTGFRFGPKLADGRRIPLTFDGLTTISLQGGIPGLLGPTMGTLDAQGEASVRVNANVLGGGVAGLRFWAAAVVLDPNAPSGVAEVTEPKVVVLR